MSHKVFSHEMFVKKVFKIVGDKYIFHTTYQGFDQPIEIECKVDGYKWIIIPTYFLRNQCKCPK